MRITLWPGATRREENHAGWEARDPQGAIKAKGRHALELRARGSRRASSRNQRNNRREY